MSQRFGIRSLRRQFASEDACLDFLFKRRHGRRCACGGTFKRVKGRKKYHCSRCSFQVAPLAGTIFEKSKVPLPLWFHALMMFSNAKSGLAAKTIQRDLEITYKCAWRMARLIRGTLKQSEQQRTQRQGAVLCFTRYRIAASKRVKKRFLASMR